MSRENTVLKKFSSHLGSRDRRREGSLIHPFGTAGVPGTNQRILREAQIDPETLAIVQRACQNGHSQQTEWRCPLCAGG